MWRFFWKASMPCSIIVSVNEMFAWGGLMPNLSHVVKWLFNLLDKPINWGPPKLPKGLSRFHVEAHHPCYLRWLMWPQLLIITFINCFPFPHWVKCCSAVSSYHTTNWASISQSALVMNTSGQGGGGIAKPQLATMVRVSLCILLYILNTDYRERGFGYLIRRKYG